jgi:hypothetical protein
MWIRRTLASGSALVALSLIFAGAAVAAGTSVSVRVEGLTRTLLPTTVVHTHSGSITKGGTPAGVCPSTSAAGALDVATKHHWGGSYSAGLGLEVTQILSETHTFSSPDYWSVWVDNKFAQAGVCGLTLHKGEQLLFAAVSDKGSPAPIVLNAPAHATTGKAFTVKLSYFDSKGKSHPLSGASVKGATGKTNAKGTVKITPTSAGKLKLSASEKGYIRSATETVTVKA